MDQTIKEIKQRFFAFRNGIIADTLRPLTPYKVIFGLQVPQLAEIARSLTPSTELANRLWNDRSVRESRLLATYLFPINEVTPDIALSLCTDIQTNEEADMLSFRLLKHLPFAQDLLNTLSSSPSISPYLIQTFSRHIE